MEDKELNKELENSANNIEVRDFSLVWDEIKGRVLPEDHTKKRRLTRWIASAAALVMLTVALSIVLPMALKPSDEPTDEPPTEVTYFMNELGAVAVEEAQFYEELAKVNIKHVDFSQYVGFYHVLFQTVDGQTKGASIELWDDLDNPTFILGLKVYDDKVKGIPIDSPEFDLQYQTNNITIYYRVKEAYPEEFWYVYELRANYNSVNYYMQYTCFTEDITPFLDEFFN